jgi:hypothetical protein
VSAPLQRLPPHLPRETWQAYLDDRLEGAARARVEDHAAGCAECLDVLLAADPSRAFGLLGGVAPAASWDGFWEELQPRLGADEAGARRLGLGRRTKLVGTLAAAAALALAAMLVTREPARLPDPCGPSALAEMHVTRALSKAECEALFGSPIESAEPEVVIIRDLDLRGL